MYVNVNQINYQILFNFIRQSNGYFSHNDFSYLLLKYFGKMNRNFIFDCLHQKFLGKIVKTENVGIFFTEIFWFI